MELLQNLNIDSIARTVWCSKEAKDTWEQPIAEISQMLGELEVLSVVRGHRAVSWQTIGEETYPQMAMKWGEQGLLSIPLVRVGQFEGFAHKHAPILPGQPANVCVILAKEMKYITQFRDAYNQGDNVTQGNLLGYPECCSTFFEENWKKGYYDPIFQSALNSEHEVIGKNYLRITKGHPYSNSALRYGGIRLSFHIVCSFDCEESIRIGEERMRLFEEVNPEMAILLKALLKMPFSWDVYHGMAVIRTPIFYIITSSVPAKNRHVIDVSYEDPFIPKEGKRGLVYPFNMVEKNAT